jgi:hypothetical protein
MEQKQQSANVNSNKQSLNVDGKDDAEQSNEQNAYKQTISK